MKSKKICALITLATLTATTLLPNTSFAADTKQSTAITPTGVVVTNKFGTGDTILVPAADLQAGDKVTAYKDAKKTVKVGEGTVAADKVDDLTITTTADLGNAAGNIYLTRVDAAGDAESPVSAAVAYGQAKTPAIDAKTVTATDNVDTGDTVEVASGLVAGETVNIYSKTGAKLGAGKATAAGTAKIVLGNKVFSEDDKAVEVSGVGVGAAESDKTTVTYNPEATTAVDTTDLTAAKISNNVGKADTISVPGVAQNGLIYVYAADGTTLLASGKQLKADKSDVVISFPTQLTAGTNMVVKVKEPNKLISEPVTLKVPAEGTTTAKFQGTEKSSDGTIPADITIQNHVDTPDTVTILGAAVAKLKLGDTIKIYAPGVAAPMAQVVVTQAQITAAKDLVIKLPTAKSIAAPAAGAKQTQLSISITNANATEGDKTTINADPEATLVLANTDVTAKRNKTVADTVTVAAGKVAVNGVVRVYVKSNGKDVLVGTVVRTAKIADTDPVVVNLTRHLTDAETSVYVTVKNPDVELSNELEVTGANLVNANATTAKFQGTEKSSDGTIPADITIQNHVDTADTVTILGAAVAKLKLGDTIKIYAPGVAAPMAQVVVTQAQITAAKDLVIKLPTAKSIAAPAAGAKQTQLSISITNANATEGDKTTINADPEATLVLANTDKVTDVTAKRNVTTADTVTVAAGKVAPGGVVRVYVKLNGKDVLVGTAVKPVKGKLEDPVIVNLTRHLTDVETSVYVTVKNPDVELSNEVEVTGANLSAATATTDVLQGTEAGKDKDSNAIPADVTIQNHVDTPDTVTITAAKVKTLTTGDVLKIYDGTKDKNNNLIVVARAVVTDALKKTGKDLVIILPKATTLNNATDGNLLISVTMPNATEGAKTSLSYKAADTTANIASGDLLCTNNALMLKNVKAGDRVFVYDKDPSTDKTAKILGSALVVGTNTYAFVTFKAQTNSTVYVIKKSKDTNQSKPTTITFDKDGNATVAYADAK